MDHGPHLHIIPTLSFNFLLSSSFSLIYSPSSSKYNTLHLTLDLQNIIIFQLKTSNFVEKMTPHIRKLLPLQENHNPVPYSSENHTIPAHYVGQNRTKHQNPPSSSTSPSTSSSPSCCYNNLKLNPPFDSAMALTVLVLLTALFFMGFFSIYIRRFAEDSSADPARRRRGSETRSTTPTMTASSSFAARSTAKGVDPTTIKALPVHAYCGGGAKQRMLEEMECAICLSEFEEREWIKQIPYCGHVFHVECIDTWLASHVTCPLCRSANLLVVEDAAEAADDEEEKVERGHVAEGHEERVNEVEGEVRLVMDGGDTWHDVREVGPIRGERRSSSCSWFGERVRLQRSLSF